MTEVDVALTDYMLFLEAAWFATAIQTSRHKSDLATYLIITFAGFALASFLGGTTHGFFNTLDSVLHTPLWWATLVFIGITATGFALSGLVLIGARAFQYGRKAVLTALVVYFVVTVFHQAFLVAIIFYVPATLLCLVGLITANRRCPGRGISPGIAGLLISLIAPIIQQLQLSVHPEYFTYNAVYHVVLMLALFLFYKGAVAALPCRGASE